jgi:uncharacterized damage-inducible protein DinB
MENLQYPIGKFRPQPEWAVAETADNIEAIAQLPTLLRQAVEGLTEEQLDTPYRPGGWTVRQVVHHLADSHINSYNRFRLALTEDRPTIKPYDEKRWAELPDAKSSPVEVSLVLLNALHQRWATLLRSLSPADLQRVFLHPESGENSLAKATALYAWHGRHHLAHITTLREREKWQEADKSKEIVVD